MACTEGSILVGFNCSEALPCSQVVMLLDVDCLPPMHLSQELVRPDGYAALRAALKNGTALVVPAFEPTQGGVLYARLIAQSKLMQAG